jgi:hypothetical protein
MSVVVGRPYGLYFMFSRWVIDGFIRRHPNF